MVDAADWPDEGVGSAWERAVDSPDTGSAFDDGQSPLAAFFRGPHPPWSPFVVGVSPPLVCGAGTGTVEEDEDVDEIVDDEEFVRCALLRGIKILVTSSALMESSPCVSLEEFHLGNGCKVGGDATAVIGMVVSNVNLSLRIIPPVEVSIPLPRRPRCQIPRW